MLVTPNGISIEFRLEQPENAPLPMLVTLNGISIEFRPCSKLNAKLQIATVPSLIL